MTSSVAETAARAAVFTLTLFGIASHALLGAGTGVPAITLPLAMAAASAIAWRESTRRAAPSTASDESCDRRLRLLAYGLLGVTFALLAFGACATPSRDWDGATSWDLRTRVLTADPTLEQPFFRDPIQFAHTREYPLLQPLVLATLARLGLGPDLARGYFAAIWLLLLVVIHATWRRLGVSRPLRTILGVALGLTPMLVDPTMGSFDSGFGDASLLLAVTVAAAGLAAVDPPLLFCGTALLPLFKPEGLMLAPLLIAVAWLTGNLRSLLPTLGGFSVAVVAWLPLYQGLNGGRPAHLMIALACLAAAPLLAISARQVARMSPRGRIAACCALAVIALGAFVLCRPMLMSGGKDGVLGVYLAGLRDAPSRVARLPQIVVAMVAHSFTPRRFGLLAPLLLCLAVAPRRHAPAARRLATLLCLTLASLAIPFLTSPEADLDHHIRSSLDRLLFQQVGVAWLLAGLWWNASFPQPAALDAGVTR